MKSKLHNNLCIFCINLAKATKRFRLKVQLVPYILLGAKGNKQVEMKEYVLKIIWIYRGPITVLKLEINYSVVGQSLGWTKVIDVAAHNTFSVVAYVGEFMSVIIQHIS